VVRRLETAGYAILGRNLRVGPREIDVLAARGPVLVVCEVKSRRGSDVRTALASIDARKVRLLREATLRLRQERPALRRHPQTRFDAAAVLFDGGRVRLVYREGAF
jgi:putative endonuclease